MRQYFALKSLRVANTQCHPRPLPTAHCQTTQPFSGAQRQTQIQPVAFIRLPEFRLNESSIYILRSNAFHLYLLWQAEWNRGDEHLNFKLKIDFPPIPCCLSSIWFFPSNTARIGQFFFIYFFAIDSVFGLRVRWKRNSLRDAESEGLGIRRGSICQHKCAPQWLSIPYSRIAHSD